MSNIRIKLRAMQLFLESSPCGDHTYTFSNIISILNEEFGVDVTLDTLRIWSRDGGWQHRFQEDSRSKQLMVISSIPEEHAITNFGDYAVRARYLDFERNESLKRKVYEELSFRLDNNPEEFRSKDLVTMYKALHDAGSGNKTEKPQSAIQINFNFGTADNYSEELAKEKLRLESSILISENKEEDSSQDDPSTY